MENQHNEFLKQQLIIASKNGWGTKIFGRPFHVFCQENEIEVSVRGDSIGIIAPKIIHDTTISLSSILFSHSFCKTLWGDYWYCSKCKEEVGDYNVTNDKTCDNHFNGKVCGGDVYVPWQYHIQQMALAENRLQYLKDHPGKERQ